MRPAHAVALLATLLLVFFAPWIGHHLARRTAGAPKEVAVCPGYAPTAEQLRVDLERFKSGTFACPKTAQDPRIWPVYTNCCLWDDGREPRCYVCGACPFIVPGIPESAVGFRYGGPPMWIGKPLWPKMRAAAQ